MPASPILLLPFQITVREQLTSRALIISSFSGMCNNCRVQTPSRQDGPREPQPMAACSLKTDLLWEAAPTRPEVCTHTWGAEESPQGAATVTQSLRLCRGKTNKQLWESFKTVDKQPLSSTFFFFLEKLFFIKHSTRWGSRLYLRKYPWLSPKTWRQLSPQT